MLADPIPQLKQQLHAEIMTILSRYPLTVGAEIIDVELSRVSKLARGDLTRFSLEKLIRILATVDRRIDMRVVDVSKNSPRQQLSQRWKREKER